MTNYDLSSPAVRQELVPRLSRYWQRLGPGRALGLYLGLGGSRAWRARYRTIGGKYRETTLGLVAMSDTQGLTYPQAVREAENWFASDAVHQDAVTRHVVRYDGQLIFCPIGSVFTVGAALRDYVEWKRIAAAKSHFDANLSLINHHLARRLASIPLAEFTGRHFQKLCIDVLETPAKRGNRPLGPRTTLDQLSTEALRKRKKTMNALTSILRGAFTLAWENGEIENDRPIRCLRHLPNVDRPRMVYLSREECIRLLDHARPDLANLILGALYTGCRVRELANMRVGDVARDGFGVHVSPSKNYRPRYVFLPEEGMAFFLAQCDGKGSHDYLFVNADGRPWSDRYKHLFKQCVASAGLPDETVFHSLRHTYASQLVQAGMSLAIIAKQLGHADIWTVSRTYGHLAPQTAEEEVQRRFAPITPHSAKLSKSRRKQLDAIREKSRSQDWRAKEQATNEGAWPRANFSKFSGETLAQIRR